MDTNKITYLINDAIFEVNRELGVGFLEKVYKRLCSSLCICGSLIAATWLVCG
ncbi:MAG: hypothetical protein JSV14_00855 [Deltaproteobacteria bacterium]|nr:MAG: hypothetical protein JSV14_00855 [Deltaproteobacteria bacterium]